MNIILWNRYQVAQIICALEANRRKWSMHRAALSGDQAVVKNGWADINLMPADVSRTHTLRYRKKRREAKSEREREAWKRWRQQRTHGVVAVRTWRSASLSAAIIFNRLEKKKFSVFYFIDCKSAKEAPGSRIAAISGPLRMLRMPAKIKCPQKKCSVQRLISTHIHFLAQLQRKVKHINRPSSPLAKFSSSKKSSISI